MAKPSSALIEHIYRMAGIYTDTTSSDAELIQHYAELRDERAFSSLMVRHGLMVWSICHRILCNTQDAEEAYQTTFLALAHKAKKVRGENLVAWLHHVAQQTAAAFRRKSQSRDKLQKSFQCLRRADSTAEDKDDEIYGELHCEIAKLPEKLRVALVLHYLEGKTQAEVAAILGVKEPSVWSRLNRGKAILEKRLSQQGLVVGAGMLSSLLTDSVSNAAMPPGLVNKTVKAATAFGDEKLTGGLSKLAKEVLKNIPSTAPWWKTGWMIGVLCVAGVGLATGGIAWKAGFFGTNAEVPITPKGDHNPLAEKNEPQKSRLDRYGDPLPEGALVRLGTVRLRHAVGDGRNVTSLAFTPDGKSIMTAGPCNPPRLWDVATGKLIRRFGDFSAKSLMGAVLSPDARFLAGRWKNTELLPPRNQGGGAGTLHIWETATGRLVREFDAGPNSYSTLACAFSPDGRTIAARLHDQLGCWDTVTGRARWVQEGRDVAIVTFSPDGKIVATGNQIKGGAVLRDAATGRKIREVRVRDKDGVQAMVFRPDGETLLVNTSGRAGDPPALTLWDLQSGKAIWNRDNLYIRMLSPDGKTAIVSRGPWSFHLVLDAATGKEVRRLWGPLGFGMPVCSYSPDGRTITAVSPSFVCGSVLRFWDSATFEELPIPDLEGHRETVSSAFFTPDGGTVVTGGADGSVRFWDAATGRERQHIWEEKTRPYMIMHRVSPAMSPNGKMLAVNFAEAVASEEHASFIRFQATCRSRIRLWDAASGKELQRIPAKGETTNLVYSSDGKWLAAAVRIFLGNSANTYVWNTTTGMALNHVFSGAPLWLSNDGRLVTAVPTTHETNLKFWNMETGKLLHAEEVASRAPPVISSDGRLIAGTLRPRPPGSDLNDPTGKLSIYPLSWKSTPTRVVVGTPREVECTDSEGWSGLFAFSPDNRILAYCAEFASNGVIRLLEICSGRERVRFSGHLGPVTTLCFAADGKRLATGSRDSTLLVWDVAGRFQDEKLRGEQHGTKALEKLWNELASKDASRAGRAVWALTAIGHPAVEALEKRLSPAEAVPEELVRQLIAKLDSHDFRTRKQAQETLRKWVERLAELFKPLLEEALDKRPPAEMGRNLKELLAIVNEKCNHPPVELVRGFRALEVLEHIGTPDAVRLLQKCAAGEYDVRLSDDARRSLHRLEQTRRLTKEQIVFTQKFQP